MYIGYREIKNWDCNKVIDTSGLSLGEGVLLLKHHIVQLIKKNEDLEKRIEKME